MMNWYHGALLPPAVDEDADADPPKSCLLDRQLFLGDRTNATTASYHAMDDFDDIEFQVTLFVARPPSVSYILAWSTDTYFTEEPLVLSTHGGLVLLSIAIYKDTWRYAEYYIYQPGCGHGGGADPSLDLIPQPSGRRLVEEGFNADLLSHGGGGGYYVAVLTMVAKGEFDLFVFSSDTQTWTLKKPTVSLPVNGTIDFGDYVTDKAFALGGSCMAFVDLWNGILICDVLDEHPELHYLPLPSTNYRRPSPKCLPLIPRDACIDVVSGDIICIRFAEVACYRYPTPWRADTWITTTTATSPWHQLEEWHIESSVRGSELSVADGINLDELLELDHGDKDKEKPTIGCLFVDKPMLSLHGDNVVCFIAKYRILEMQEWMIAVDMVKKELQAVNPLQVGRITTLFYSTISSHLNMTTAASGQKGDMKRLGSLLESYPLKKQQHLFVVSSSAGEEEQGVMGAQDGDDMGSEHEGVKMETTVSALV